jgi:hypothetical protein
MNSIVEYDYIAIPEVIKNFEDILVAKKLKHLASELTVLGIDDPDEINEAIEKAITVCRIAGVPVAENFKPVYFCKNSKIYRDWRLSGLAFKLAVINSDIRHKAVSVTQVELIK